MPRQLDKHDDALVIGFGAAGSIAMKELTERGPDVLLREADRATAEADFIPPGGGWGEAADPRELVIPHQTCYRATSGARR